MEYPPLVFRPDHGDEVQVTEPAELAGLLEENPQHGRSFLYGKYIESGGWDRHNPGLCAALASLVDQRYPNDRDAGLAAAVYLLDPARPYRSGRERFDTYTGLAEHLVGQAAAYSTALRGPNHVLWIYLSSRPDDRARDGVSRFSAAFSAMSAGDTAAAEKALHQLVLWLRSFEGNGRLPFAGVSLSEPAEILKLSSERKERDIFNHREPPGGDQPAEYE